MDAPETSSDIESSNAGAAKKRGRPRSKKQSYTLEPVPATIADSKKTSQQQQQPEQTRDDEVMESEPGRAKRQSMVTAISKISKSCRRRKASVQPAPPTTAAKNRDESTASTAAVESEPPPVEEALSLRLAPTPPPPTDKIDEPSSCDESSNRQNSEERHAVQSGGKVENEVEKEEQEQVVVNQLEKLGVGRESPRSESLIGEPVTTPEREEAAVGEMELSETSMQVRNPQPDDHIKSTSVSTDERLQEMPQQEGDEGCVVAKIETEATLPESMTSAKMPEVKLEPSASLPPPQPDENAVDGQPAMHNCPDDGSSGDALSQQPNNAVDAAAMANSTYTAIEQNIYIGDEARGRERRKGQEDDDLDRCDCSPTKEELKAQRGCGENCIHRQLYIECETGCPSGKRCTNRRFQRRQYADVEVFDTGAKGFGLRARSRIPKDSFIMEYQGEVVDSEEMCRRIRHYGRDPTHRHHYMMALRNGAVIDATRKGNVSRFINHSCDPNAVTQKWTVAGQFRVGFFAVRSIEVDEEVTFNYQFERYGKQAQKCLCGTKKCTGYIGTASKDQAAVESAQFSGDDEEPESGESDGEEEGDQGKLRRRGVKKGKAGVKGSSTAAGKTPKGGKQPKGGNKKPRQQHRRPRRCDNDEKSVREMLERKREMELAEVTELLSKGPLRNREHVLAFNRMTLWVKHPPSRRRMLEHLLAEAEGSVVLRLFVADRGATLIGRWLELENDGDPLSAAVDELGLLDDITRLLNRLPIKDKRQVETSNLLRTLDTLAEMEIPSEFVAADTLRSMIKEVSGEETELIPIHPSLRLLESIKDNAGSLLAKWRQLSLEFKIPKRSSQITVVENEGVTPSQNKESGEGDGDPQPAADIDAMHSTPTFEYGRGSQKGFANNGRPFGNGYRGGRRGGFGDNSFGRNGSWVSYPPGWHERFQTQTRRPPPPPPPRKQRSLTPLSHVNQPESSVANGDRDNQAEGVEREDMRRDSLPQPLLRPKKEESPQYHATTNHRKYSRTRDDGTAYEGDRTDRAVANGPRNRHPTNYHYSKHQRHYGRGSGGGDSRQMDRSRRERPSYDRDHYEHYDERHRHHSDRYRHRRDSPRRYSNSHSSERRDERRRRRSRSRSHRVAVRISRRSPSSSSSSSSSEGSSSGSASSSSSRSSSASATTSARSSSSVPKKAKEAFKTACMKAAKISTDIMAEAPKPTPAPVPPPTPLPTTPAIPPKDKILNRRRATAPSGVPDRVVDIPPPTLITPPKVPHIMETDENKRRDRGVKRHPPTTLQPYEFSGGEGELEAVREHIGTIEKHLHQWKIYHDALERITSELAATSAAAGRRLEELQSASASTSAAGSNTTSNLSSPARKLLSTFPTAQPVLSPATPSKLKAGRRSETGEELSPQLAAKRRRVEIGRDEDGTDSSSQTTSTTPPEDPTMAEGKGAGGGDEGKSESIPSTSAEAEPKPVSTPCPPPTSPSGSVATSGALWVKYITGDGKPYYYNHKSDCSQWTPPPGAIVESPPKLSLQAPENTDDVLSPSAVPAGALATPMSSSAMSETAAIGPAPNTVDESNMTLSVTERRRCFKQRVVHLVGEYMRRYRHRFFSTDKAFLDFLRKVSHKVIDSPDNENSLEFSDSVKESTRRLLDDYIRKFHKAEKERKRLKAEVETATQA